MIILTVVMSGNSRVGTAEEVADVILFLWSHEARFIQGQVIEVNGGFS